MLKYLLINLVFLSVVFGGDFSSLKKISKHYENEEYSFVLQEVDKLETQVSDKKVKQELLYLKGAASLSLNEFEAALKPLVLLYKMEYKGKRNLYYMLGQTFFALEKYRSARIFFKKSVEEKFKIAVSLYYAAFSSQKLKDYKTAAAIYSSIEKVEEEDKKEVLQAARMQLADIYYDQARKLPGAFSAMEKYVVPQYQKALEFDKESNLAEDLRKKIRDIQQKYELVLYKMRNGRPTAIPPYFIQSSFTVENDSNVNSLTETEKVSADEVSSLSALYSLYGRYSFYPNSKYSLSPDFRVSYQNYFASDDSIKANNNYSAEAGLTTTYEHFSFKKPATTFLRLAFNHTAVDSDSDSSFSNDSNTVDFALSEELRIFGNHTTTFRVTYKEVNAKDDTKDANISSFIIEQVLYLEAFTNYTFFSYGLERYNSNESEDVNTFQLRNDFLFASFKNWFNLGFFVSVGGKKYLNDDTKGAANTLSYGLNLNRPIAQKWFVSFDFSTSKEVFEKQSDEVKDKLSVSVDYVY